MSTLKYGKIGKNTCRLTDFCPKTSLLYIYVVISKEIQFDKSFHLVVLDLNYPICIFMNIYEILKNDRKIIGEKNRKQRLEIRTLRK